MKSSNIICRLRKSARRLEKKYDVLAVGIGLAYSENRYRFSGRPVKGRAPHWTNLAIKVLVKRKYTPAEKEHLPRYVKLLIGKKRFSFRVDVTQAGERWPRPGRAELQAGSHSSNLSGAGPFPGRRMAIKLCPNGVDIPASGNSPLPGCRYQEGTVGWIGQNKTGAPYVITSAHVLGDVYPPHASGSLIQEEHVAVSFNKNITDFRLPTPRVPFVLPPSVTTSGAQVVDVAALRLPFAPNFNKRIRIPSLVGLYKFLGAPAFVRVEREQEILGYPGIIENIVEPSIQSIAGVSTKLPRMVVLRFRDSRTTVEGDSGAPVLVRRNNKLYLLGFHFVEFDNVHGQDDFRTTSCSVPAGHAFSFLKLKPFT